MTRTIDNPYAQLTGGRWLRGNLHAHTVRSDGERTPEQVVADYAQRGYDFLMLSDHDVLTTPEDLAALPAGDMRLIPGSEISADGPHLLHVAAARRVPPDADRQRCIDQADHATELIIACHPNWKKDFNHTPIDELRRWRGYVGLEIYNGVIGRLDGSPYATDKWDMLLSAGRRVWGFANDDSHAATGDVALGWNVVYATDGAPDAIVHAMRRGQFYASTGVTIESIEVDGDTARIRTANAQRITAIRQVGRRIATADDPELSVRIPDDAVYLRFECYGSAETRAWSQPLFITNGKATCIDARNDAAT